MIILPPKVLNLCTANQGERKRDWGRLLAVSIHPTRISGFFCASFIFPFNSSFVYSFIHSWSIAMLYRRTIGWFCYALYDLLRSILSLDWARVFSSFRSVCLLVYILVEFNAEQKKKECSTYPSQYELKSFRFINVHFVHTWLHIIQ